MILLNAILAGGLLAAAAPVIVHILHRRKLRRVDWGAMRFLLELLAKSRRRIFIERWLLLAIRIALVLCLALAFTRPALEPAAVSGDRIVRHGRTAAILLLDDSLSAGAGRAETRWSRVQAMAERYLDSLGDGDEISVVRLSDLPGRLPDPLLDRELAREQIRDSEPRPLLSDVPALLDAAVVQLGKHINPNVEVVLLGDGGAEGWHANAAARWAELRARLQPDREAAPGSRGRPRLLLCQDAAGAGDESNLAVTDLALEPALVTVDAEVAITATITLHGERDGRELGVELLVDDAVVDQRRVVPVDARETQVVFRHRFLEGGSHALSCRLVGARDVLAGDDRRDRAIEVIDRLPVLLVEGRGGASLDGSLAFVSLALSPDGDDDEGAGIFAVQRIGVAELLRTDLDAWRTVVLGDVGALDNDSIARLEAWVVGGGGLLVIPGPDTDIAHVNRFWSRQGDGFLPCPLAEPAAAAADQAVIPVVVAPGHPALGAFRAVGGASWEGSDIRQRLRLATDRVPAHELTVLLTASDGAPLLVERGRGAGRVALYGSSMDLAWSDLPVRPAFVPLVRGVVAQLGSSVSPPRNLPTGARIAVLSATAPSATAPDGSAVELTPGTWQGRAAWLSEPVLSPGIHVVQVGEERLHYAVTLAAEESALVVQEDAERERLLADTAAHHLGDAAAVAAAFDLATGNPTELWRWLILAVLVLLFCESWYTRSLARREQGSTP